MILIAQAMPVRLPWWISDRLRHAVEKYFDAGAVGGGLARRISMPARIKSASLFIVRAFSRPVDVAADRIDGDTDAPAGRVARVGNLPPLGAGDTGAHNCDTTNSFAH